MKKNLIIGGLVVLLVVSLWLVRQSTSLLGGGDGFVARGCTPTATSVRVGTSSVVMLDANSRRAWAKLELPNQATSTLFASFSSAATTRNSTILNRTDQANGATSTPSVVFGLNTELPYTGIVTGFYSTQNLTTGSSTVIATQCVY